MKRAGVLFGIALALACGGGGNAPLVNKTLTIKPTVHVLVAPDTFQFSVDPAEPVTWSASRGSIDANGLFTVPNAPGQVTVSAALVSDPSAKDNITFDTWFNRRVDATYQNHSAALVRMIGPIAGVDISPGSEIGDWWNAEWTDEQTIAHYTFTAQVAGQPDITNSVDITAAEARDPNFHKLVVAFDGAAITIVKN